MRLALAEAALPFLLKEPNPQSPTPAVGELRFRHASLVALRALVDRHRKRVVDQRPYPADKPWLRGRFRHTETVPSRNR